MIYKVKSKKRPDYKGLDCSGPNMVLPPTFCGIPELVKRAGSVEAAALQLPQVSNEEVEGESIVREFLNELEYTDKAERNQLIQEFSDFVEGLQAEFDEKSKAASEPVQAVASGGGGTQTEDN